MDFSGERFLSQINSLYMSYEHWHRYFVASEFVQSKVILDIASGEGYGSYILAEKASSVVGVGLSEEAVHYASSKYPKDNLEFLLGSVTNIPVKGESVFDVIISFETIEHISFDDQQKFMQEVKRLLKPGGVFIVSTPNKLLCSDIPQYQNEHHVNEYYIDEFVKFLGEHFKNFALLGQKVYPVSYIWPFDLHARALTEHRVRLISTGFNQTNEAKEAVHVIAVCSTMKLPEIGPFLQVDLSQQMMVEIQSLQTQLAAVDASKREREFKDLSTSARISDRDRSIKMLSARLAQEEQIASDLREQLHNAQQAYEEASRTLVLIYSSTGWKLLRILWAIRLFLAPHGSRREALARWLSDIMHGHRKLFERAESPKAAVAPEEPPIQGNIGADPVYVNSYENMLAAAVNARGDEYVQLSQKEYSAEEFPVKAIAFYLPQFHPIPENDQWWGKGFTEWRNVTKAVPQFLGHYQPHLPGELGFYDLRIPEVQQRQVELAKQYGIYGFCFYYYWFNGKRLLEHPLEHFLSNPAIDFPFCLCWANENWTRTWDGQEREILMEQVHSEESDLAFIRDVLPILQHKNYIKIAGQPVLIIYRAAIMPDPKATVQRWKTYCKLVGAPEPYLISAQTFGFTEDPHNFGFDATVEFPPHEIDLEEINEHIQILNSNYQGVVFDYRDYIQKWANEYQPDLFHTVFPSWDNEPRKPGRGSTFAFSTPALYQEWLTKACTQALKKQNPDERIVFINAWNEWAEGAHLEPDQKYGYAYLQATADALASLPEKLDSSLE